MPMWVIYHSSSTFTSATEKSALATDITKIYTAGGLPPFYVCVHFIPLSPSNFYSSMNEPVPMVRITIQNIARTIQSDAHRDNFLARVDTALKPHIEDKGYDWEYSVLETSRDLWKINGIVPPMPVTEAEGLWKKRNKAVPFEREKGGL
ncbi:hypothetical protein P280DRAFT_422757 [Massarina eburnea CBS 473.64]|uniref:Tautomerase cis-CaaD-like domain-containing protein n=1 Tax=Massarina eburnea CBS 473.64 TaxID=1395130 RepID=A0A6A6S773_9PLEO|nr:hypothetical protein P280DRAFT_422757 [Massarina eburnea CBS 473.64]